MTERYDQQCEEARRILDSCQSATPEVSIVVPAYNEGVPYKHQEVPNIVRTIKVIAEAMSETSHEAELICVDNNSDDPTPDLIERCGARLVEELEQGVSYARITGQKEAKADKILCADADMVSLNQPDRWVHAHMRHYEDPNVVGVGSVSLKYDPISKFYRMYCGCTSVLHACQHFLKPTEMRDDAPFWFCGANMSYQRDAANQVGGFIPGQNRAEDQHLGRRLQSIGRIVEDGTDEIGITTDGRRVSTLPRVLFHIWSDKVNPKILRRKQVDFHDFRS